jgi:hypothetical protein
MQIFNIRAPTGVSNYSIFGGIKYGKPEWNVDIFIVKGNGNNRIYLCCI